MTNCPNYGAPMKDSKCEYCGTEDPKRLEPGARILITANGIEMCCGLVAMQSWDHKKMYSEGV